MLPGKKWLQSIGLGALAAVLPVVVDIAENQEISEPRIASALIVGLIVGSLFELYRRALDRAGELRATAEKLQYEADKAIGRWRSATDDATERANKATNDAIKRLEQVSTILEYQQRPLEMLLKATHLATPLQSLVRGSIGDEGFRHIPFVSPTEYLSYLEEAIEHSRCFQGVQRKPLDWFDNADGKAYLMALKKHPISKTRIFIIDEEQEGKMEEQLRNPKYQKLYWTYSDDVSTYWMTTKDFKAVFSNVEVPKDFALFNEELLIEYNEDRQTLSFNTKDLNEREVGKMKKIFDTLKAQNKDGENAGRFKIMTDGRKGTANAAAPATATGSVGGTEGG